MNDTTLFYSSVGSGYLASFYRDQGRRPQPTSQSAPHLPRIPSPLRHVSNNETTSIYMGPIAKQTVMATSRGDRVVLSLGESLAAQRVVAQAMEQGTSKWVKQPWENPGARRQRIEVIIDEWHNENRTIRWNKRIDAHLRPAWDVLYTTWRPRYFAEPMDDREPTFLKADSNGNKMGQK